MKLICCIHDHHVARCMLMYPDVLSLDEEIIYILYHVVCKLLRRLGGAPIHNYASPRMMAHHYGPLPTPSAPH